MSKELETKGQVCVVKKEVYLVKKRIRTIGLKKAYIGLLYCEKL